MKFSKVEGGTKKQEPRFFAKIFMQEKKRKEKRTGKKLLQTSLQR